ncbi:hypothetical protein FPV67DRAFT_1476424 [Lyophyllum atratum]|nr:hypothetical protein FPV67DRAFT_1476424 [Lyophyllum atratum]
MIMSTAKVTHGRVFVRSSLRPMVCGPCMRRLAVVRYVTAVGGHGGGSVTWRGCGRAVATCADDVAAVIIFQTLRWAASGVLAVVGCARNRR